MTGYFGVLLVGLYAPQYPMACESHGLSTLAGCLKDRYAHCGLELQILDRYMQGANDEAKLLKAIRQVKPILLGLSVPYGTYDVLSQQYSAIRVACNEYSTIIVFGGALPTYAADQFLTLIDPSAVVVRGEGEDTLLQLIEAIRNGNPITRIPNISYCDDNEIVHNGRKLQNLSELPIPERAHLAGYENRGIQIFVEASRGCSWSACTFCPRGLSDVSGRSNEHRFFDVVRVQQDLEVLYKLGYRNFTFSDEDFIGSNTQYGEALCDVLLTLQNSKAIRFSFDVSMNVRSFFRSNISSVIDEPVAQILRNLRSCGMRKVFLGVESGSKSQLHRYHKGHLPEQAVLVRDFLTDIGIEIEVGFILFDPLCDWSEVKDNISFLVDHNFAKHVSSLGSNLELRIQLGSGYMGILEEAEKMHNVKLFDRRLNYDTLTFPSRYLNSDVQSLVNWVRSVNRSLRPLYYPLKSLSRYGMSGPVLRECSSAAKSTVREIRESYAFWLSNTITSNCPSEASLAELKESVVMPSLARIAQRVYTEFNSYLLRCPELPIITTICNEANKIVQDGYF